jgi:hypothetical protein
MLGLALPCPKVMVLRLFFNALAHLMPPATTLTQARIVFTLAHLHLVTGTPGLLDAAHRV